MQEWQLNKQTYCGANANARLEVTKQLLFFSAAYTVTDCLINLECRVTGAGTTY